jgi:SAM-dependent methyltransferase
MVADAYGRALLDCQHGGLDGTLRYRDGESVREPPFADHNFSPLSDQDQTLLDSLGGPCLVLGCGSGQRPLYLQDRGVEVLATDVSPGAVQTARERGVENAVVADMFDLPFPRDRFRSVTALGTQLGLAGSLTGVREWLGDAARITDSEGTLIIDSFHPEWTDPEDCFGFRDDPRPGVMRRAFHVEYDPPGDDSRIHGRTLEFVFWTPAKLRDLTVGTPWEVVDVSRRNEKLYWATLEKPAP